MRLRVHVIRFMIAMLAVVLVTKAIAQEAKPALRHGLSLFGNLKYKPGFKHFDYVNPNAPKGGLLRLSAVGTYDNLNPFIIKGRAAAGSGLIYDQLLTSSADEPGSQYGLLAEAVSFPKDFSSVTYKLRKQARWHDGKPVTPEDVIFSLGILKKSHPFYAQYYTNVVSAKKTGPHEVTFSFNQKGNRELPLIAGELNILPKHYWEGVDKNGKKRVFSSTTLTPPLGSGPYKIGEVKPGRSITYERVKNYWAEGLPVAIGRNNFDAIRYEYFRDGTITLEAFKGNQFDVRFENSAKNWATAYKIKSVSDGLIIRKIFETKTVAGMQGFAFNTRRPKFADKRVRQAFGLVFDFDWSNKNLFFGQYTRTNSFFERSELASSGLPTGQELAILNDVKDGIPPEVFTTVYKNPTHADRRAIRSNLRTARKLLNAAGWKAEKGILKNTKTGEVMNVEFLLVSPDFERVVLPYIKSLKRLGIQANVRTVDVSQYQNRLDSFDFDVIVNSWGQSLSPGNEQRGYWGSISANRKGSRNYIGIKDKAIDKLIDKIIFAKDRAGLVAATRALDRVLLWHHFVVPQWHSKGIRSARWDRFGLPKTQPDYNIGFPDTWWFDEAKAKRIGK